MPLTKVDNLIQVPERSAFKLKYKDIFDIKALYTFIRDYLVENGWYDEVEGPGSDHWETYNGEKIDAGGSREIWMYWSLVKDAEGAPLRYYLDFNFHALGLSDAEVIKDGKKLKVNKGELEFTYTAYIEKRYEKEFSTSGFLSSFKDLFTNRVYRQDLEVRKKELYQEMYVLNNYLKQWLKFKHHLPYEEVKGFYLSFAWPSHLKDEE